MNKKNLDRLNSIISEEKSGWLEKAKWREENEGWLDISFAISVKILGALRKNKKSDTYPKNQKQLAEAMDCSPQYVNKVLKGAENLQLETISRIGKILNIQLIEVPKAQKIEKVSTAVALTEYFEEYFSLEKIVRKSNKALANPKFPQTKKVEQKGIAYSTLMDNFSFAGDFDNDPKSSLKLVA